MIVRIPSPRLGPDGTTIICDTCNETWVWGESQNCAACKAKWDELEKQTYCATCGVPVGTFHTPECPEPTNGH